MLALLWTKKFHPPVICNTKDICSELQSHRALRDFGKTWLRKTVEDEVGKTLMINPYGLQQGLLFWFFKRESELHNSDQLQTHNLPASSLSPPTRHTHTHSSWDYGCTVQQHSRLVFGFDLKYHLKLGEVVHICPSSGAGGGDRDTVRVESEGLEGLILGFITSWRSAERHGILSENFSVKKF